MAEIDEKFVEEIVRKIITEKLSNNNIMEKEIGPGGVVHVKTGTVKCQKFDTGKEGDNVLLTDILTLDESPYMGCGVMEMTETTFDWTLNYEEIDYVIEGTLEIVIGDKKVSGSRGDIIMIPRNSKIKFSAPKHARFLYCTYPANWAEEKNS
ncbi:MAG TPA: ethanolamine utilization protein [Clostridiaceae bacterium]|nr:ethanolamine utilization protein [Clostridiaceae bacterium]